MKSKGALKPRGSPSYRKCSGVSSSRMSRSRFIFDFIFSFHFLISFFFLIIFCGDLTNFKNNGGSAKSGISGGSFGVLCDEINGQENSDGGEAELLAFDPSTRGNKKFGDRCESTSECGFPGSVCDAKQKTCQCVPALEATNHIDKCGRKALVNETCRFTEQCESMTEQTECRDNRCICRFEMSPFYKNDGSVECRATKNTPIAPERYVDPAMIGVLVAMAVMFIIICVVLRLFSKARWSENRSIFNTPNPRLMNVSLLKDNKLHAERRGSRMSVRLPSRQPSMASLRPHSPSASIGSRRGSRGSSNASATSTRSNRSQHANNNGHHAPVESVTVEITQVKT